MIYERGLDTHLPATGFIESGGVDLYCAGRERTAIPGAHVGVHSWWSGGNPDGVDLPKTHEDHVTQLHYFAQIGCPVSFYEYTLNAAPGTGMYIMNQSDLLEEGVVTEFVKRRPVQPKTDEVP